MSAPRSILQVSRAFGGSLVGAAGGALVGAVVVVIAASAPEHFELQRAILLASATVGAAVGWRLGPRYFRWSTFLLELLSP